MPSTIGKCKSFRIKHITILEGGTFLRNKHEIAFFEIKCTFFGRKENTISFCFYPIKVPEQSVIDSMPSILSPVCMHVCMHTHIKSTLKTWFLFLLLFIVIMYVCIIVWFFFFFFFF